MKLVLEAEWRKFVKLFREFHLSFFPMLIFFYLFFLVFTFSLYFLKISPQDIKLSISYTVLGYILWIFTIITLSSIPQNIFQELGYGTFEHLHLSIVNIRIIFLIRSIINTLQNIIVITIFIFLVKIIHHVSIFTDIFNSLTIIILMVPGIYGFAYLIASLVLTIKNIGNWIGVLNFILIIPLIIPQNIIPEYLNNIFSYFPMYQGALILRKINIFNITFLSLGKEVLKLFISSILFFILGLWLFDKANILAKKKGLLGTY